MERAASVLGKLKVADDEKLAQAAWPVAVGRRLASRTGAVALYGSHLVVQVEDAVWQLQLGSLRGQILRRLEEALGRKLVTSVEFRVALPRPRPKREEAAAAVVDEADGILNPVMRDIYKASRKRASR